MAIFNKKIPGAQPENEPENTPIEEATPVAADDFDFNRYFLAERRIALENVSYETTKPAQSDSGYKLTGRDTVVAQILGNTGVKVTYNRTLKFEPDGPFTLSVSYAVMLIFNPGTRDEVDWKTVDVAAQFRKHCAPICANISSRISLLIAEITSASGQPPMIIGMASKYDKKAGMGTIISMMIPYSVAFLLSWIVMVIAWVLLNLPLGPGASVFF